MVADGAWRELVLYGGGEKIVDNCQRCPKTCALLDKIPEATSLALAKGGEILISILEPGTHLRPHCGPSNNRYVTPRCDHFTEFQVQRYR